MITEDGAVALEHAGGSWAASLSSVQCSHG